MKKLFFSFVMLVTLVIVAGSAKGQNTTVIQGGTYQYTLKGIVVNTAGTATIAFDGDAAEVVSITSGFSGTSSPYTAPAGSYDAVFTVKFSSAATSGNLVVTITDGSTDGCSNHISLPITVLPAPTINLAIIADETLYCQKTTNTNSNTAASVNSNNTITFTVTPTFGNLPSGSTFTWGYKILLPNTTSNLGTFKVMKGSVDVTADIATGKVYSGIASTVTSETYTVTFITTTGIAPQSLVGTVSDVSVTEVGGGSATYNETDTSDNSKTVTVKAVPSIGSFQ